MRRKGSELKRMEVKMKKLFILGLVVYVLFNALVGMEVVDVVSGLMNKRVEMYNEVLR